MDSKPKRPYTTQKDNFDQKPRFYFKEPIVVITFTSKKRKLSENIILGGDQEDAFNSTKDPERADFIHTFSCLNLFRHKYITECYDANPMKNWLIIPDYKANFVSFLKSKSIHLKFKAIRQIFKLALFFESMNLQDYIIDLDELYYEDFGNSFCIKFYNFSGSWFGETGKLKKHSALKIAESLDIILGMLPDGRTNIEFFENKREELERIILFDTIHMDVVHKFIKETRPDNLSYVSFIRDLLKKYANPINNNESSYILRKISKVILSMNLRKALKTLSQIYCS